MAPHADKIRDGFLAQVVRLLGPRPGRLAYAARLALICALTALVVEIYQTPSAALTVYVAFFLNKPDRVESLLIDVVFVVLVSFILGFLTLVAMAVIDVPLWRVLAITIISFALMFLVSASKLRPIGAIFALIIGFALDLIGTLPGGEFATRA